MKPEEQGPRSRFGPSAEDLTNTLKQVRTADRHNMSEPCRSCCASVRVSASMSWLTFVSVSGHHCCVSRPSATEAHS